MNNNRNNNNNNRRRGRGNNNRQQGGQQLNRIDSRARGNAPQMLEKYRKLAHDSHLNGDRVNEEYYLQFADHYFRVIADQRVRQEEQRQPRPNDRPAEYGDEYAEDDFYADANSPYDRAGNYAPSVLGSTQGNAGQGQNSQNGNYQNGGAQNSGQGQGGQGGNVAVNQGQGNGQAGEQRADQQRSERGRRNNRDDRPERGERPERGDRGERSDRGDRQPRAAAPVGDEQLSDTQAAPVAPAPADADERTLYEPSENPFVRSDRAARTPRARKPRRDDAAGASGQAEPAANLDPSMLPPAISRRDDAAPIAASENAVSESAAPERANPESVAEEAPAKPKRRTRRATPPADDAAGTLETVN